MEGILRVDTGGGAFPGSPSNSFLADEIASTCPLITPSPPTNALVNSLPEQEAPSFLSVDELTSKLHNVKGEPPENADSSSSSSSALAEPSCTQLLNNHNSYLHMTKDENTSLQDTGGKTQSLQMTFRNPAENYFFMKWNWPLIRKISVWVFVSILIAMLAVVIAMVWNLPKTCNPPTQWYQGNMMYEIFPASFADSNDDNVGDFNGISLHANYTDMLHVRGIRLNSIFASRDYPEDYHNITSLFEIAPILGNLRDFTVLVNTLHSKNMYLLLDFPLWPYVKKLRSSSSFWALEVNHTKLKSSKIDTEDQDAIAEAINYWVQQGVDGFYLKGLEHFVDDPNFAKSLRLWKKIVGPDRVLLVSEEVIQTAPREVINVVLNNVDLVDVKLQIEYGVKKISKQIRTLLNGTLFSKGSMPWIHWNLGGDTSVRLANRLSFRNATLGATLLQLMLPGTPSIFYGDEIGLHQISDHRGDRKEIEHLHQLTPMEWKHWNKQFTNGLPWMHGDPTPVNLEQLKVIISMTALRATSPSIYMNAVPKNGVSKANAEVKYSNNDLLVIQRWYPRRKNYVVVSNLGAVHLSADLSTLLYSGSVVVGATTQSTLESISFKDISLWPGESVVILLD